MANKDRSRKSGARKRKFYGNQHSVSSRNASRVECGSGDVNLSASARKLRFDLPPELRWAEMASDPDSTSDGDTSCDDEASEASELTFSAGNGSAGTRLVDLGELQRALDSTACCKRCKAGRSSSRSRPGERALPQSCVFRRNQRTCGHTEEVPLAKRGNGGSGKFFEVNRCAVLAMRMIGRGLSALLKICCILNMPRPMAKSSFDGHRAALHRSACTVAKGSLNNAAAAARAAKEEQGSGKPEEVEISTDGTWMRRGFISLFGVCSAIYWGTGQLVDVTVLSKHCAECLSWQSRAEKHVITAEEYTAWNEGHADTCK